jgi:hypothetical protein
MESAKPVVFAVNDEEDSYIRILASRINPGELANTCGLGASQQLSADATLDRASPAALEDDPKAGRLPIKSGAQAGILWQFAKLPRY